MTSAADAAPRRKAARAPAAKAAAQPVAAPKPAPLLLDEVLASSRFFAPQVLEALARVRGAEGRVLTADAAFDTVFSADAQSRIIGKLDGTVLDTQVTQPLADWGGFAYGGYRISRGSFPSSEGGRFTNEFGEIRAGAVLALMRDRAIDDRRFARNVAEADVSIARTDQLLVAIGVQTRAIQSYNNWVFSGLRLKVFRELLKLSIDRQAGFKRQVEEGARPSILLTENEQNILRRQTLVVQAEQALAVSATNLSLFLRDANGNPLVPDVARLPPDAAMPLPLPTDPRAMVVQRPDIKALDIRIKVATERLAVDRNAFLPRLDFRTEINNDIGRIGVGGGARSGTEAIVGLSFSLPIQQRAARGRLAQTNADIDAIKARRRFLEDQITVDIDGLGITAVNAGRVVGIAADEADRALTMAAAERRRFELGAGDFFLVNIREESAADARVRQLEARFRQVVAQADLAAATADLDALGL
jgi:outer membrane protein TolC